MRRRVPIITAVTAAGLLALGGAAYAGGTGEPEERCGAAQVDNVIAVGGVCPDLDTLVNLPVIDNL